MRNKRQLWPILCGTLATLAINATAQPAADSEGLLNFKAALENHPAPYETQIKTLLEGDKAFLQSGGLIVLTGVKVRTFGTNGAAEMIALAPHCIFDSGGRMVSSTGFLQVQSADGKFLLEGEGFTLGQTNALLILSNRVHTVVRFAPGTVTQP